MALRWLLPVLFSFLGQAAPPGQEGRSDPAARLEFMKTSMASYQVHSTAEPAMAYPLQAEPALRFTNPISGVSDGAVFFWIGGAGRPEATVQFYQGRSGTWVLELTSLSTAPFTAEGGLGLDWRPERSGVEFRSIAGAPRPAETASERLRQMHALARAFAVEDHFQRKSWHALRLLARPLARYGEPGSTPGDGAVFSFVLGTNPEAFLMIESRIGADGAEWQYALAPMTGYALKGSYQGQEVWSLPPRTGPQSRPTDPWFVFRPRTSK
jgi:hypothetical protein